MKNKSIGAGLILILLGAFWMLQNLGFVTWSIWEGLFDLWPLILVVIGVNLIFKDQQMVKALTWVLFFVAVIGYGFVQDKKFENIQTTAEANIKADYRTEVKSGQLKLDLGAGNINIDGDTEKLLEAYIPNPYVKNNMEYQDGGRLVKATFKENNHKNINLKKSQIDYIFHLNEDVVWDMDLDMGAGNGTFDLSKLAVSKLDLDMGAGNFRLNFGNKYEHTKVDIDAGASNIEIVLPKDVGARIKVDGLIKNSSLKNLNWNYQNDRYLSPNYHEAESVIDIDIDMGVGQLDVILK